MSEEKIVKHTKKAVHVLTNKKKAWKEKIKEISLEIIIIVFAVSITLLFHNWNDAQHEHKIAKNFLEGISGDLKEEADKLDDNIKFFQPTLDYYDTVWAQIQSTKIDSNYIDKNSWQLLNTIYYVCDNGRFESFKSSGYLRLIENRQLLKDIVSLYTVLIPFQENIDKTLFVKRSTDYDTYIGMKSVTDSSGMHVSRLMKDPAVRYQVSRYLISFKERKQQQAQLAKEIRTVISEIDKELD